MVDRLSSRNRGRISLWPIAALRVYTGVFFVYNGFRKVVNERFTEGMVGFLNSLAYRFPLLR